MKILNVSEPKVFGRPTGRRIEAAEALITKLQLVAEFLDSRDPQHQELYKELTKEELANAECRLVVQATLVLTPAELEEHLATPAVQPKPSSTKIITPLGTFDSVQKAAHAHAVPAQVIYRKCKRPNSGYTRIDVF